MEQTNNAPTTPPPTGNGRPTFLTVLCILSFIGSGLAVIIYLLATIAFSSISGTLGRLPGMGDLGTSGGSAIMLVFFILAILSLVGVIMMWKLKKKGFYIYSIVSIIALFLPLAIFSGASISALSVIITFGFIVMYALNLKAMK